MLQKAQETGYINMNCVDPLGRSALLMAIDNENLEMVELLINHRVDTKDALLHAISEEFVEAVEVLLDHEDCSHRDGDPHVSLTCFCKRKQKLFRKSTRSLKLFLSFRINLKTFIFHVFPFFFWNLWLQQSWEALPHDTATFTPGTQVKFITSWLHIITWWLFIRAPSDITPLILAAHRDNYGKEKLKILTFSFENINKRNSSRLTNNFYFFFFFLILQR